MRDVLLLLIHLLVTVVKLVRPGGVRTIVAESLLLKHQILIINRSKQRAPNLTTLDRFVLGLTTLFLNPRRIPKPSALIKPATLLKFHKALVDRKYGLLFSSSSHRSRPGPKGPPLELISAIVELKRRQSLVRLCTHRAADLSCLWRRYRQRCCASRAHEALPSRRLPNQWPVMADIHRKC